MSLYQKQVDDSLQEQLDQLQKDYDAKQSQHEQVLRLGKQTGVLSLRVARLRHSIAAYSDEMKTCHPNSDAAESALEDLLHAITEDDILAKENP